VADDEYRTFAFHLVQEFQERLCSSRIQGGIKNLVKDQQIAVQAVLHLCNLSPSQENGQIDTLFLSLRERGI
jgi:hypothetical protein